MAINPSAVSEFKILNESNGRLLAYSTTFCKFMANPFLHVSPI